MLDCGGWWGCESPAKLWQTCATAAAYGDLRVSDERSGDDLLHQLRIDRTQRDDDESRPRWPWIVGAAVLVLVIAGVAAAFALRGQAKEVATSTAVTAASSSDAAVLQATGYVVARRQATISAQIIGTLTQVSVDEGAHVEQGQVLARLDPTAYQAQLDSTEAQYAAAQASVVKARAMLKQDRANAARMNDIVDRGYVSKQAAEQANTQVATDAAALDVAITQAKAAKDQMRAAQVNLDFTVIRAPFAGVVTAKGAEVGEIVSPYTAGGGGIAGGLATIVDMNSLEVQVDVSENYIERVQVGAPVTIHLDAYPDWDIPGSVIAIIPTADQSKGTVQVRVAIKGRDPRILPQMAARVAFLNMPEKGAAPAVSRVTVPVAAVLGTGKTGTVFVIGEEGKIEKRDVALGLKTATAVTILSGISAGERLASDNLDKLHDGDRVKVAEGS